MKTKSIAIDYEKVIKTYKSCVNWVQFENASKLHKNFVAKWCNDKDILAFHDEIMKVMIEMTQNLNGKNN